MRKISFFISLGVLLFGFIFLFVSIKYTKESEDIGNEKIFEPTIASQEVVPHEITLESKNGERFQIPISSIPDLEEYLDEVTDINAELERMQVEHLNWNRLSANYFILKYGCGNKLCNLVLIQITGLNEVKTKYVTEGIIAGSDVFEENAMIRIAVNEGSDVARHQMILIDLSTLNTLHPIDNNDDALYFTSPLYPITQFKWITAHTIELVVADIPDTTYESVEKWYKVTNPPVNTVKITIE